MENAGAIALSPTDRALITAVIVGAMTVGATMLAAIVGLVVGALWRPSRSTRYGGRAALVVFVAGAGFTVICAMAAATEPGPTGVSGPTRPTTPTTRAVTTTTSRVHPCMSSDWTRRTQASVTPQARPTSAWCSPGNAVVDIVDDAGSPQPVGRRTFWRQTGTYQWTFVGATATAGCGTVLEVDPHFPTELCADLPLPAGGGNLDHIGVTTPTTA